MSRLLKTAQVPLLAFQKIIFSKNDGGGSIFFELKIISTLLFFGLKRIHILHLTDLIMLNRTQNIA
jgi:hypothetical protein